MPLFSRNHVVRLPDALAAHLSPVDRGLGTVPLVPDGERWAVATTGHLLVVGPDAVELRRPWHEVARGSWDAETYTFSLSWTDSAPAQVLEVARRLGGRAVDVAPFARALRQRVESALVHAVSDTLPSGVRVTVSVRRDDAGALYTMTTPASGRELDDADRAALRALERRVHDAVGLPTS